VEEERSEGRRIEQVDRSARHLIIGILIGVVLAGLLGGAAMIQTATQGSHEWTGWYYLGGAAVGLGVVSLALLIVLCIRWRHTRPSPEPGTNEDLCGNPKVRRDRIRACAKHLEHEFKNFENWWWALEDKNFDEVLPGKGRMHMTHARVVATLQFIFARFFSAVRTYEVQCPCYALRRKRIMKRVIGVYDALYTHPNGEAGGSLNFSQLYPIGEFSTNDWGDAKAKPFTTVEELEAAKENDPRLAKALEPLENFFLAAGPNTPERSRIKRTEKALRRVRRKYY